jgi:hypothetical protein
MNTDIGIRDNSTRDLSSDAAAALALTIRFPSPQPPLIIEISHIHYLVEVNP